MTDLDLCGYCRNAIPDRSVSDYFCGPECPDLWNRERSEPLGGRSGKPHLTWDQQSAQIRATMAALRDAFSECSSDFSDALRSLEPRLGDPR